MDLTDTTTLVTGASKGLGTAYAHELARRGSHLTLIARPAPALEDLAADIRREHRVEMATIAADLTSADDMGASLNEVRTRATVARLTGRINRRAGKSSVVGEVR
ncbi:SDR family NAD(P)-dependent oxidoreductase [Catenuloplanes atrovinosus]|uniref:Short-subunit dehydrogenase n=1 Tax=Catenuloplanes atrovinosus TaxID=137266 RepID=A0AAE3YR74_9ACTN|nr:SDR family NAD(P)-dependent oxidoreductase [Catenuloplanes atrovinosus]MDR7277157.1 short-subunit dehydrogenase [Catenuloplanes atrovinosus]